MHIIGNSNSIPNNHQVRFLEEIPKPITADGGEFAIATNLFAMLS
jgi:hypothetical protein